MRADHTDAPAGCEYATVYVAFELSKANWQLGILVPGAEKMSRYRIDGGNLAELSNVLARARARAEQLGKPVRVLSCYEAGRDGHWLHRWRTANGIVNYESDASR
jgi:transposase